MLTRKLRPESRSPTMRFRGPNLHLPLWLLLTGWLCVLAWRGVRWLARHPRCSVVLAVVVLLVWTDTVMPAGIVLVLALLAALGWWAFDPATFRRVVLERVQLELRRWLVYQRDWQPAMLTSGLSLRESWGGDLPTLHGVRLEAGQDVLRVRMLPGQTVTRWKDATAALAQTWGARQVRVRRVMGRPQELDLVVVRRRPGCGAAVTERPVDVEPEQEPAGRGAFPRQPRGGAA